MNVYMKVLSDYLSDSELAILFIVLFTAIYLHYLFLYNS